MARAPQSSGALYAGGPRVSLWHHTPLSPSGSRDTLLRRILRNASEWVLLRSGAAKRGRRRHRDDVVILAYHNVVPDDGRPMGDRSLHLPLRSFRDQLDHLETHHEVVPLEALDRPGGARSRVAITFDDAYAGALELAIPELVDRGMPASVFVCPGLLGEPGFWWDRLAPETEGATLDREIRATALDDLQGRQHAILERFESEPEDAWWMRPGDEEAVVAAAGRPGITIGCHTWAHPNLTALSRDDVASELERTVRWIGERTGDHGIPHHLSFPYGLYDDATVEVAGDLGFEALYRIEGGVAGRPDRTPWVAPRLNVPSGVSRGGFELRTSGAKR